VNDRLCTRRALSLAIAIALGGCVPPGQEVVSPTAETKDSIVGGNNTTIQEHPWQISLRTNSGFHFCGGSILNDTWILTAAHCVDGSSPSSMRVLAGVTRLSQASSGQLRSIAQILVFPGYSTPSSGRDAALLRLSTPLDLSGANARPIAIATEADRDAGLTDPGVNAVVTGWGALSSGGSSPDVLQEVTVPIVSEADAEDAYNRNLTDDQIAAGLLNVGGRDSCQGDSGGPLTVADATGNGRLLAGIVSWGNGCADPDFPGMYSRVSSFASWIQSNVTVNTPPNVSITSPASGTTISGAVTVSANASDPDGTIARVRFVFPDGSSVDDTTSPYSTTWDSSAVGDGQVEIRAQAFDNLGATAVASVQVTTSNGNTCTSGTFVAGDTPISIPDNNSTGIGSSIDISGAGTISSLSVSLSIDHTWRGDLRVVIHSPSGTSHVIHDRTGSSAHDLVIDDLSIGTFDGESIDGVWTLAVQDLASRDVGTLQSFSLSIVGDCGGGGGGNWSGSRSPNLATRDNGSVCDSVTVSQSGDASQVRLDLSGRHDYRSILRGTLSHDGVTVTAFPTGTFPRGAGTFGFTDRAIAGFSGDAAGVWTLCIIDTDGFGDTGVLSSWSVHN
jgi:secreted trypsin-like serine protease/subtilisin-like proprotein convertase family protein